MLLFTLWCYDKALHSYLHCLERGWNLMVFLFAAPFDCYQNNSCSKVQVAEDLLKGR